MKDPAAADMCDVSERQRKKAKEIEGENFKCFFDSRKLQQEGTKNLLQVDFTNHLHIGIYSLCNSAVPSEDDVGVFFF